MPARLALVVLVVVAAIAATQAFSVSAKLPGRVGLRAARSCNVRMSAENNDLTRRRSLIGAAFAALLAGPAFVEDAEAAIRSGGRISGGFKRSSSAAKTAPAAPAVAPAPVTVINTAPAPVYGGFGGGYSSFGGYGGFASFGPPMSPGMLLGLSAIEIGEAYVREQRRAEFMRQQLETQRKLGEDSAKIEALQREMAQQEALLRELNAKQAVAK